jgi:hypothetical protein
LPTNVFSKTSHGGSHGSNIEDAGFLNVFYICVRDQGRNRRGHCVWIIRNLNNGKWRTDLKYHWH